MNSLCWVWPAAPWPNPTRGAARKNVVSILKLHPAKTRAALFAIAKLGNLGSLPHLQHLNNSTLDTQNNKTQCHLCKRLAGQIIVIIRGAFSNHFFCVLGHFGHGDEQTNKQLGSPRASLLLTSEKAVFCNFITFNIFQ